MKTMTKRLLLFAAALCIVCSAGCGKSSNENKTAEASGTASSSAASAAAETSPAAASSEETSPAASSSVEAVSESEENTTPTAEPALSSLEDEPLPPESYTESTDQISVPDEGPEDIVERTESERPSDLDEPGDTEGSEDIEESEDYEGPLVIVGSNTGDVTPFIGSWTMKIDEDALNASDLTEEDKQEVKLLGMSMTMTMDITDEKVTVTMMGHSIDTTCDCSGNKFTLNAASVKTDSGMKLSISEGSFELRTDGLLHSLDEDPASQFIVFYKS